MYVHPVKYETGARKKVILETKLMKAKRSRNTSEIARIEREISNLEQTETPLVVMVIIGRAMMSVKSYLKRINLGRNTIMSFS